MTCFLATANAGFSAVRSVRGGFIPRT